MSDYAQAPDWWLASDGKWYPPQSRNLPPPPSRRPGLPPALSGWMQGLLWAGAAIAAISALMAFALYGSSVNFESDPGFSTLASWSDVEDAANSWSGLASFFSIAVFVLIIVWSFQAHKAASVLQPGHRRWTRGWTVGGWFIPFANAVIPFLVIAETQRIADAGRVGSSIDPQWRWSSKTSNLGLAWWLVLVGSFVVGAGSSAALPSGDATLSDISGYQTSYLLACLGALLRVAAGVLGALYIRSIARCLSPSGLAIGDRGQPFS